MNLQKSRVRSRDPLFAERIIPSAMINGYSFLVYCLAMVLFCMVRSLAKAALQTFSRRKWLIKPFRIAVIHYHALPFAPHPIQAKAHEPKRMSGFMTGGSNGVPRIPPRLAEGRF